jgi:hypothetical protein
VEIGNITALVSVVLVNVGAVMTAWVKLNSRFAQIEMSMRVVERYLDQVPGMMNRLVAIETRMVNGMTSQIKHMIEEQDSELKSKETRMSGIVTTVLPMVAQWVGGYLFKRYSINKGSLSHKVGSPLVVLAVGLLAGLTGLESQLLQPEYLLTESAFVVGVHSIVKNIAQLIWKGE